ncbi:DrmB family protein [Psychrobacter sp. I-STPA10]|uniref:DrmB family protein n=1 Tax=Psychrobacter sp. I-STPA10 TaxID=2585769 RepID=UPI001E437A00|nr:DrmB family protein [Psychrobacter sp. I-STPA10]
MVKYTKERKQLVQWVKTQLSGETLTFDKKTNSEILIESNPFNRYTMGILYPSGLVDNTEEEVLEEAVEEDSDIVSLKSPQRYQPPSSMGFSFYVDSTLEHIKISYKAVRFEYISPKESGFSENRKRQWKKSYLDEQGIDTTHGHGIAINQSSTHYIYDKLARIDVTVRDYGDGKIITVTLSNAKNNSTTPQKSCNNNNNNQFEELKQRVEGSLFEVELSCHFDKTALRNYPRVSKELLTEEEKELELRYKDQHVYAIGHGVAVDWKDFTGNQIMLYSDFMPSFEVPQVTANTGNASSKVLDFEFLQSIQDDDSVLEQLDEFVENYLDWIETQEDLKKTEDEDEQVTAQNIIDRMHIAAKRMKSGIAVLQADEKARQAFALANQAMLAQMQRSRPNNTTYKWRPFQLAFFLMVLESSMNEEDEYRDLVDLIWFPTGGGKTEAYLGVMAFLFVYRRLNYTSSGNGTIAIMRYTLRLLTSQQFVRACKVIGALELIRRQTPELGEQPFTVGLWLGGSSSPNEFHHAIEMKEKQNFSKFVLNACPWCDDNFTSNNYQANENSFHFTCTNQQCCFGKEQNNILPFNVVDDALYAKPPSLLIATVDKFARLAWDERAHVFIGGKDNRPPELIIQDELHLISGALGSIVGLYEAGLEAAITSRGVFPKFIASTATIRQATEQVKALFGRDMAVFPPVGLRQKDSYFAKEVPLDEKPGRLYVGYLAFNRQRKNCLEDLSGALLAVPQVLYNEQDALKDAWWTQMVYHSSLKGVGNSQTNFQNNIAKIQKRLLMNYFISEAQNYEPNYSEQIETQLNSQSAYEIFVKGQWSTQHELLENADIAKLYQQCFPVRTINTKSLTGNNTAETNTKVFNSLKSKFYQNDAIDAVLATNMVSVGLDEPRLALMVMNGQPLTTAEYIQASSRVGRGDIPGIVFVNYYKTQARSLSHYENFRAYHSSFYRFVEPSSLTPFTEQVRHKALHAALVTAIRHGENGLLKNTQAEDFFNSSKDTIAIEKIIKKFKQRIQYAALDNIESVNQHLDILIEQWKDEASSAINLRYKADDKAGRSLLASFENDQYSGVWQTLNSMRNVEKMALFEINLDKDRFIYSDKWFTPVRFSHLMSYSGVGSVVHDNLEWLVKVSDTKEWAPKDNLLELHAVERVKKYFQTEKKLLLPPEAQVKTAQNIEIKGSTLPVARFPAWMHCRHCGLIYHKPWELRTHQGILIDDAIFCTADSCRGANHLLKQIIWCTASNNGDLRDVPWHYICHRGKQNNCVQEIDRAYLKIQDANSGKKEIYCSKCRTQNLFEKTEFKSKSGDTYVVTEVNDARIYTPHTERALVIPPESNIDRNSIIYQLQSNSQLLNAIESATHKIERKRNREIRKAIKALQCTKEELLAALDTIKDFQPEHFVVTNMLNDEYEALITAANFPSGADFVTRHLTEDWTTYINAHLSCNDTAYLSAQLIDKLVAIDRLRVIEIFKGFSRDIRTDEAVSTDPNSDEDNITDNKLIPPDIEGNADWLPAIELFGEGIFFTLDSQILKQWETNEQIRLRANQINLRYQASDMILTDDIIPTPRFILMHTLAHLLIRELESSAGYPAASLKERLYCSTTDDNMAGIMIYTAVPDIAGTLGGIVQLVEPARFLRLLDSALRQAQWCSLDPVCGEMERQGPSWLNRAACHACALVPDTCCNYNNVFLDRVFIKGNSKVGIPTLIDVIRNKNGETYI